MKKIKHHTILIFFIVSSLVSYACNYAPLKERRSAPTSASTDPRPAVEQDLETMRTANFEYIFVFRRKDGGAFDSEDRKYLRANSPSETNRFIATDEERAFIAGSKYKFPPESLEVLRMRFNVEDYSAQQVK